MFCREPVNCFLRTHLDHGDNMHDKAYNFAIPQKLEPFQYNGSLTVTGTRRIISREKYHQELGLESLQLRRWYRELCCFVKIYNSKYPDYFLIPTFNRSQQTRNLDNTSQFKHNFFKNSCSR